MTVVWRKSDNSWKFTPALFTLFVARNLIDILPIAKNVFEVEYYHDEAMK